MCIRDRDNTMRKLKAGIVGCGGIANGEHLPAMKKSGLYEIVAFCDIVRERAEKAKEEYGTEDALSLMHI